MLSTNGRVTRCNILVDTGLQLHLCGGQLNSSRKTNVLRNKNLNICIYSTIGNMHHYEHAQREYGNTFYSFKLTQHA